MRGVALGVERLLLCILMSYHASPQLAEALPMPGSGLSLPLDLASIAARCKGSYYAPRRFAVRATTNLG